jgi:membrane fusion protein, multidrug efflux system
MKNLLPLMLLSAAMMLSACGKKAQTDTVPLRTSADEIKRLSLALSQDADDKEMKRFIAEVKAVIDARINTVQLEEEFAIIPVGVDTVGRGTISETLSYLGDIQAKKSIRVYSKVPDRIEKYFVEEGDYVYAGDPIAQISDDKLQQAVNQARAALQSAKTQLENIEDEFRRIEKLWKEKAVSESQYEQIKTQLQIAKNGVDQATAGFNTAQSTLQDALVKSPITGVITEKLFKSGDMVSMQAPIVTVSQINPAIVVVNVVEYKVGALKTGMKASLDVPAFPGKTFYGEIIRISPVINPQTRTAAVEIEVPNRQQELKPGMFAKVEIYLQTKDNVILVKKDNLDKQTISISGGESLRDSQVRENYSVFLVKDSVAYFQPVELGIITGSWVEVKKGLNIGDIIVNLGRSNLQDGSLVKIVKSR